METSYAWRHSNEAQKVPVLGVQGIGCCRAHPNGSTPEMIRNQGMRVRCVMKENTSNYSDSGRFFGYAGVIGPTRRKDKVELSPELVVEIHFASRAKLRPRDLSVKATHGAWMAREKKASY